MLRITLHYGTNQRGPTIKIPLAVALIGQSCILTQGLGGINLVSKNTGGKFVWKPPIKANFLSDQEEGEVNQTIKLAHSFFATTPIWRRWILWKGACPEGIGLGPIEMVPLQSRASYVVFLQRVSRSGESTQIFSIFHSQYAIQVESILQFCILEKSPAASLCCVGF